LQRHKRCFLVILHQFNTVIINSDVTQQEGETQKNLGYKEGKNMVTIRRAFLCFSAIALILIAGTNPIVWMLAGPNHFREKIIETVVEEAPTNNFIRGAESETDKALKLFEYLNTHIFHSQRPAGSILKTPFLPFLIPGDGGEVHGW
jgi:hypothetical protein